ncbi:MAG: aminofutalosine synthase MqnE [Planctomycetota bacterium]|nr:aminofutalosine synthase MqnE [Planctomycetota bacterium]
MLDRIEQKIESGERLTFEDGLVLSRDPDLLRIGGMANRVRETRHGNKAYYVVNQHINYSNICKDVCLFCAFGKKREMDGAYELTLEEIYRKAEGLRASGADEIHIVGGLHPDYPYDFYKEMLSGLRDRHPNVHLKTFTAVEIDYLAELSGLTIQGTLEDLREAGLQSMTGGGAEIFAPKVRKKICATKISAERYMEIHGIAHRIGLRSTTTMLYGHIESDEDRVDHILRVRDQQDISGGFTAFIPLAFHPANTHLAHLPGPTAVTDLRCISVARLLLDNVDHIKSYWIMVGLKVAQLSLHYGADDIDGTVVEEHITHMAGATSPQEVTEPDLRRLIEEAGRQPIRRDSLYNEVSRPTAQPAIG